MKYPWLRSKIFSQINHRLKAILDTSHDFGGLSIICVGDFHQLRPVKDSYVFQVPSSSESYAVLVGPYLWEEFSFVELNEIMRQKDDQRFAMRGISTIYIYSASTTITILIGIVNILLINSL